MCKCRFFIISLHYLCRSTLLQQTQKVLGLLPSFLRFCIRLVFPLATVNADDDSYRCSPSLASVSHRRLGDLFWTFQLHGIISGLCLKQYYWYIFCSSRFQVSTETVSNTSSHITDQERDPKQGPVFLHLCALSQHFGPCVSEAVSEVFHCNVVESKLQSHGDTHWRTQPGDTKASLRFLHPAGPKKQCSSRGECHSYPRLSRWGERITKRKFSSGLSKSNLGFVVLVFRQSKIQIRNRVLNTHTCRHRQKYISEPISQS